RAADAFVFVAGEYNWGMQPGLKNLTDHFLEEWFWRPAAIASYSAGRIAGARSALLWHGTLSEMGMIVISSTLAVGPIAQGLTAEGKPIGEGGSLLDHAFPRFADDLFWWSEAAKMQRARRAPPYLAVPGLGGGIPASSRVGYAVRPRVRHHEQAVVRQVSLTSIGGMAPAGAECSGRTLVLQRRRRTEPQQSWGSCAIPRKRFPAVFEHAWKTRKHLGLGD